MDHLLQIARNSAAAVLIGTLAMGSMVAPAGATAKTSTEQFARQICQSVIRVRPGVSEFDGCVSSLVDSVQNIGRDRAVAQARKDCFAPGLEAGSADLDLCLLRATDAKPGSDAVELADTTSAMTGIADDPRSSGSYFAVTRGIKFHREQQACALLGFDPAFGAFANCVASLQGTLQALDAPDI